MKVSAIRLAVLSALGMLATVHSTSYGAGGNDAADSLKAGFENPPASAKPRVWWHWMNGNITQEGIRADMEWMQRVGIGGLQNFDAAFMTPEIVKPRLVYMTPEWQQAFRFAAQTADRLGLELSIAGSPGWSESGGPWVKPQEAMKKIVWSETRIEGNRKYDGRLPKPPATIGPFQNIPIDRSDLTAGGEVQVPELYRDVAVIAYRLPTADTSLAELKPQVTSSGGKIDGNALWDGDLDHTVTIPLAAQGETAWVQMSFEKPQTFRALSLVLPSTRVSSFFVDPTQTIAELQSSNDGKQFTNIMDVKASADVQQTLSFAAVTARYFRLVLPTPTSPKLQFDIPLAPPAKEHRLAEWELHSAAYVDRAEDKAAFFVATNLDASSSLAGSEENAAIDKTQVVNLTSKLRADGTLTWTPPAGRWAVLRMGYSLLGITNHPASPEGTGLEVDKLSREHVQSHITQYLNRYQFLSPELIGQRGLHGMVNDSWEAGAQNWTENMATEFKRRRGYELLPWLPALTGRVIGSTTATERFLWDYRRTLGELLAENHYQVIANALHERGMIHYAESHESGRAFIGDGMDTKRFSDVPMSAMWASGLAQAPFEADIRESASVAHIYGQNLVAAESFTAAGNTFAFTPEALKPTADRELASGLNRFVIHTSVHQPLNDAGPGFTLGPFGQWFTRHETWAEQAAPWISYLARSSYLLQQGQFVADVLYFYGEDSNVTALYGRKLPAVPEGYNYDFANLDVLSRVMVKEGALTTQSGMTYRVLVLDPRTQVMSLDALKRIQALVQAGATIIGAKPQRSPSLVDDEKVFRDISDSLWGTGAPAAERSVGQGRVISGVALSDALLKLGVAPDFSYNKPEADAHLMLVHRRLSDGDLYFVNNRQARTEQVNISFRVSGKAPELWHADTGRIEPASYRIDGNRTDVGLNLDANDAVFVVFRNPASQTFLQVPSEQRTTLTTLSDPWELRFPNTQGAPATATFSQLTSWTNNSDQSIKYYSGTATYIQNLNVPAAWLNKTQRVELDLGAVRNLAEVVVNGKSLGVLWKAPFHLDITDALQAGNNKLEVRVTNTWVNRLIGDKQPGASKHAFTTFDPYKADSPLLESGLLGPVKVVALQSR